MLFCTEAMIEEKRLICVRYVELSMMQRAYDNRNVAHVFAEIPIGQEERIERYTIVNIGMIMH